MFFFVVVVCVCSTCSIDFIDSFLLVDSPDYTTSFISSTVDDKTQRVKATQDFQLEHKDGPKTGRSYTRSDSPGACRRSTERAMAVQTSTVVEQLETVAMIHDLLTSEAASELEKVQDQDMDEMRTAVEHVHRSSC